MTMFEITSPWTFAIASAAVLGYLFFMMIWSRRPDRGERGERETEL